MESDELSKTLNLAVQNLFQNQPNIFEFTSETNQTEWSLAHHLANEIHRFFPELDCDLDVTKANYDNRRPDIIFHKRGTHENNFLVIELKKDGGTRELEDDINKIREHWFSHPLSYQFGSVIDLRSDFSCKIMILSGADR